MQVFKLSSASIFTLDDFESPREEHCDMLIRHNDQSENYSSNFRDFFAHEVWTSLHIDLAEDLVRVIDLYTWGKNHQFVFHEKQWQDIRVLSLEQNILGSLKPCKSDNSSKTEHGVIQKLVGKKLFGFDIFDDPYAEEGHPNPLEIMTEEESIFLVPDKTANWWLNKDNKFIDLPALRGFNHRIEDARVINRTMGPYLQLVISRCEDEGSETCSNCDLSSDCEPDANESSTMDPIAMDFFRCSESSEENTMDFVSPTFTSTMSEESNTPEDLNLAERYNESLESWSDSFNDSCTCDACSSSGCPISEYHFNSREWTPPSSTAHLNNDIQFISSANGEKRARGSHIKTISGKTHVLELGAGSFQINDCSISPRNNRKTPNPNYGISSFDSRNNFVALAYV